MKKFIIILLSAVILSAVLSVIVTVIPCLYYTHRLSDFGVSIKIPGTYIKEEATDRGNLLNVVQKQKGITITAVDLGKDFWSKNEAEGRIEEYLKIISTANYDANILNIKKESVEIADKTIGRVEYETKRGNTVLKTVALLTENDNGNLAIEISGLQKNMLENSEEIEKIISSIKIGKNKHVYEEKIIFVSGDKLNSDTSLEENHSLSSGDTILDSNVNASGDMKIKK